MPETVRPTSNLTFRCDPSDAFVADLNSIYSRECSDSMFRVFQGRTALHMAASRGRTDLMNWLVRHSSEAFVNARDRESGYTPLHRSIFYGQVNAAVALMKIGEVLLDLIFLKLTLLHPSIELSKSAYGNPLLGISLHFSTPS